VDVSASVDAAVVTVTARLPGVAGNVIAVAENGTNTAWAGGATALAGGSEGPKAFGVVTQAAAHAVGATNKVPVWWSGHFNIDALVWDASFSSDALKMAAFDGAAAPTQIVLGKR